MYVNPTLKHLILIMGILPFFAGCMQEHNKGDYQKLTSEAKHHLPSQLKTEPEKEFNPEFIRTTDLKQKIHTPYGFEGAKLRCESRNSSNYYVLAEFPKDSPWSALNDKSVSDFFAMNFTSISEKIPNLVSALTERCKSIYAETKNGSW